MPLIYVSLLLVAYALPWMSVPTVSGLTVSAYDLAEWASIHPAVRTDMLLLTPLLLRLPLVCLAIWFATQPIGRWLRLLIIILLALASLPPLEFFTIARSDANYQQQFVLALMAFVGGAIVLAITTLRKRYLQRIPPITIKLLAAAVLLIGVVTAVGGMLRAHMLFQELALDAQIGIGSIVFIGVVVLILGGWLPGKKAAS
jgi:hypothetical protein